MAAAAAAAAAAIAAKPAGQININLGGGGAGGGSGQARANGSQGAAGTQSSAMTQGSVYDFDIEGVEDKPWTKPGASCLLSSVGVVVLDVSDSSTGWQITGADPSDWFNYGFNEEAWKAYCQKQKTLREEYQLQSKIKV
jgi:pre-mRNA 3'-end-processing factor FIP1